MGMISRIHKDGNKELDKKQACREYIFLIETRNISIDRIECHDKFEILWNTGKRNEKLQCILHNLNAFIDYPIGKQLTIKQKLILEKSLFDLLESITDWSVITQKEKLMLKKEEGLHKK